MLFRSRFARLLFLLVQVFSVLADLAYGRLYFLCNLDKVELAIICHLEGLRKRNYSYLCPGLVNEPYFACPYLIVEKDALLQIGWFIGGDGGIEPASNR